MNKRIATHMFESLASGVRLDIVRLLVRHGHEGLVAGEIAETLSLPRTNLSFHLKTLTQAGLLNVTQEGRYQRYRANLGAMEDLVLYLTENCCAAQSDGCALPGAAECLDSSEKAMQ